MTEKEGSHEQLEDQPESWGVGNYSVSDQPTTDDALGVTPYVEALASFLKNQRTSTPLTIAIEGEWGSGKTSFMAQLRASLTAGIPDVTVSGARNRGASPPVQSRSIWFNAWRHDQRDVLWATFALAVLRQLKEQLKPAARFRAAARLFSARVDGVFGWIGLISKTVFWWLALGSLAAIIVAMSKYGLRESILYIAPSLTKDGVQVDKLFRSPSHWYGWLLSSSLLFFGGLVWWRKSVGNPLEVDIEKYLSKPSYEGHGSFVESFHRDFRHMIDSYVGSNRLFVFIDDLDRCEDGRVLEVLQAINLMIGADGNIAFIIGVDPERIANLIARQTPANLGTDTHGDAENGVLPRRSASNGYAFLEKFIQLRFRVPKPNSTSVSEFLSKFLNHPMADKADTDAVPPPSPGNTFFARRLKSVDVKLGEDSDELITLVSRLAKFLDHNPRRVKHFLNALRLQMYIAASLGLLDYEASQNTPAVGTTQLTVEQLAKFLVLDLRWPDMLSDLLLEPTLLNELSRLAEEGEATVSSSEGWNRWSNVEEVLFLLAAGTGKAPTTWRYSMKRVHISVFLDLAPRRRVVPLKKHVISAGPESDLILGHGDTEAEAWLDARLRLPEEVERAAVDRLKRQAQGDAHE